MLKLNQKKPYRFTKDEWQHVSRVLIPYVKLYDGEQGWAKSDNKTKDLKHRISEYTLLQQDQRCAYCEEFMVAGIQLDHIVPKQLHPEYCYEPKNLVSCCAVCNLYIKNADDTVVVPLQHRYEQNKFKIVHPYFNDPDVHIKYTNEDRVIVDRKRSTNLGKATIDFFEMDKYPATCKRAMRFGDFKKYPIDFIRLAKECSAYKR